MSANSTSSVHGSTYKDMEKCQRMMQKSFQSPTVKFLREQLEKAGCPVRDDFFKAAHCDRQQSGGYIPGQGIVVCGNRVVRQDEVTQAIIHELIHAFDDCRAANLKWNNCAHQACSEIRAGHLSGDCHYKRELLRGFLKIRAHEPIELVISVVIVITNMELLRGFLKILAHGPECIRRRVLLSLSANPYCQGSVAKESMEAVWDFCYNDTKPFDKAP